MGPLRACVGLDNAPARAHGVSAFWPGLSDRSIWLPSRGPQLKSDTGCDAARSLMCTHAHMFCVANSPVHAGAGLGQMSHAHPHPHPCGFGQLNSAHMSS